MIILKNPDIYKFYAKRGVSAISTTCSPFSFVAAY